jgi:hypothetical protein
MLDVVGVKMEVEMAQSHGDWLLDLLFISPRELLSWV